MKNIIFHSRKRKKESSEKSKFNLHRKKNVTMPYLSAAKRKKQKEFYTRRFTHCLLLPASDSRCETTSIDEPDQRRTL